MQIKSLLNRPDKVINILNGWKTQFSGVGQWTILFTAVKH